jgi:hypothetical protein
MPERLIAIHGAAALAAHHDAVARLDVDADPPLPAYTLNYLVSARLARNVPFGYLVPDPALLPTESIRFFTVDEAWSDALMEGILAVGASSTRDTEHVAAVRPALTAAVRRAVPLAAGVRRRTVSHRQLAAHVVAATGTAPTAAGTAPAGTGPAAAGADADADLPTLPDPPPLTGLLLRSAIVADYPGFSIRAFTTTAIPPDADPATVPADEVVPVLRMEQLAPSVLIVLFAGTPALVWIEEPHHGVQLGVDEGDQITPVAADGTPLEPVPAPIDVPVRAGAVAGVIDVAALAGALGTSGSGALATQLLRPPVRVRFASEAGG